MSQVISPVVDRDRERMELPQQEQKVQVFSQLWEPPHKCISVFHSSSSRFHSLANFGRICIRVRSIFLTQKLTHQTSKFQVTLPVHEMLQFLREWSPELSEIADQWFFLQPHSWKCLKLCDMIVYGKSIYRLWENINPVVYFPFFSGLHKKDWRVALITDKAMSSASDNVTDTATNVIGFLTTQIG